MKATTRTLWLWLVGVVVLTCSQGNYCANADTDEIQQNATASTTTANHSNNNSSSSCASTSSRWDDQNLKEVLEAWKFDPQEEAALLELQRRLSDIHHWKNDPAEVARFIKEHNFDVAKAERMFRNMIAWRHDHQIDTFMETYGEPPELFRYAPFFLLKGLDKEDDPIFVIRIGRLDAWGLYQRLGPTAMLDGYRFVSELHTSRDVGVPPEWQWQRQYYEPLMKRRVTQFTIIVDLDGLGRQLLRPALFGILQETARIAQDYYPGLAKRIILLRGPRIFKMAWKVAKLFYDPRVHHKFSFSNHDDYLEVVGEYVDLQVLPSCIYPQGGKGQPMPGWFEKIHMEGGLLPPKDTTTTTTSSMADAQQQEEVVVTPDLTSSS